MKKTLLHLYYALIRSKLDYGSAVYGSARESYLKMLEPIQNQSFRLCPGAFRSSPVSSLQVEANEMPLELRWRRLAAQYCSKVSSLIRLSIVSSTNALLHSFRDILVKYSLWASVSTLICMHSFCT